LVASSISAKLAMSHIGTFRNGIAIPTARYSWLDWFTGFERPMPGFLTPLKPPDDLLVHGDRAPPDSGPAVAAADLIAGLRSL
jgi:hypothetical protein